MWRLVALVVGPYVETKLAQPSASWLCLRRLLSAPEHASGCPEHMASLGYKAAWAALAGHTSGVLSTHVADIPSHFGLASKYFTSSW